MGVFVCKACGKEVNEKDRIYMTDICSDECFNKEFWLEKVKYAENNDIVEDKGYAIRVVLEDGPNHFIILPEDSASNFRGNGGHLLLFKMLTGSYEGKVFVTTNLWHQGVIKEYVDKLPINAEIIPHGNLLDIIDKQFIVWKLGGVETMTFTAVQNMYKEMYGGLESLVGEVED